LERALVNGGLEVPHAEHRFQPPLQSSILELAQTMWPRQRIESAEFVAVIEVIVFGDGSMWPDLSLSGFGRPRAA
jgi:hypothetical protein